MPDRDPMNIPERELQEQVQLLLATTGDLASTTLGQLRGALETRLGVAAGALAARRRVRRRVAKVVEEEVAKRMRRGPECDRVARALLDIPDYPSEVRQMLIDSLPHAAKAPRAAPPSTEGGDVVASGAEPASEATAEGDGGGEGAPGGDGLAEGAAAVSAVDAELPAGIADEGGESTPQGHEGGTAGASVAKDATGCALVCSSIVTEPPRALHPHQVRLLGIARDALQDALAAAVQAEAGLSMQVEANQQTLAAHRAQCAAATTADVAAKAVVDSMKARSKALEREVTASKAKLTAAQAQVSQAGSKASALKGRLGIATYLREGPLLTVLDGSWRSDMERDEAISAVLAFHAEEGGDGALAAALPSSLRRRPKSRSAFDAMAVRNLAEFFDQKVGEIQALVEGASVAADADAAAAMLSATRERSEAQAAKCVEAQDAAKAAADARRAVEAELARQWSQTRELFGELDSTRGRVQELTAVLAMVEGWIAGGPTPGDAEAAAGAASPAGAGAPGAESPDDDDAGEGGGGPRSETQEAAMETNETLAGGSGPVASNAGGEADEPPADGAMSCEGVVAGLPVAAGEDEDNASLRELACAREFVHSPPPPAKRPKAVSPPSGVGIVGAGARRPPASPRGAVLGLADGRSPRGLPTPQRAAVAASLA